MTLPPGTVKKWLIILSIAAVVLRLFFVILHDPIPEPGEVDLDEVDYDYMGNNIAQWKGMIDKYGEPTTIRFPLYPYFLGIIYMIFGHHVYIAFIIQALMGAAIPVIVYFISREFFEEKISLLAAAISALYPSYITYSGRLMSENLFLPFLALIMLFVLRLRRDFSFFNAGMTGILIGLASLTRGSAHPMMLLIPLWFLIFGKAKFTPRLLRILLMTGAIFIVLLPWCVRNQVKLGNFTLSKSIGPLVLWMSYQWTPVGIYFEIDRAYAYIDSVGKENAKLEVFNQILVEDNVYGQIGAVEGLLKFYPDEDIPLDEAGLRKFLLGKVKQEFLSKPKFVIFKTVKEFLRFWHFLDHRANYVISYGIMLPFFLMGIWLLRRRLRDMWLLFAFFLYAWGLETMFMADARFRMPFEIVMIVVGAYAIFEIFRRWKPMILPIGLTVLILGFNIFFTFNADLLRNAVRKSAAIMGIKVAETNEDYVPHIKGDDDE